MFIYYLLIVVASTALVDSSNTTTYLPTVLWHGMGDSCCNPFSMGRIKKMIEDALPGIYVHSVMIGDNVLADTEHGFIGSVNDQVQEACDKIANDPLLQGGFNAVGFSQGSQFLRAVAQRCPNPPTNNLINIGGQNHGVFGLPSCTENGPICEGIRTNLSTLAYIDYLQNHFVQAQYWHDPLNEETYKTYSKFIGEINNEKVINESYKTNLIALSNFVMVKFLQDSMVIPQESEWFGFYAPGQDIEVLPMENTSLYLEDRIGLKVLNEAGKLHFLEVDGDHLDFSDKWFLDEIVNPYLSTEVTEGMEE